MNAKHTPGPWKVDENEQLPLAVIRDDEDGEGVCEIGAPGSAAYAATPEEWANASLIAAAPDLLEALQDALRSVAADVEHYEDQVRHGTYAEAQDDLDEAQELYAKMRAAIAKAEGK